MGAKRGEDSIECLQNLGSATSTARWGMWDIKRKGKQGSIPEYMDSNCGVCVDSSCGV